MDHLPFIVLRSVILHVKHQGQGRLADLLACSRVNKALHDAAMPILCGIISLNIPRLKNFTRTFAVENLGGYVRSLTILIQGDAALNRDPSGVQAPHPDLRERVQSLAPMIKKMGNLDCFSVTAAPAGTCFVSREDISALLDSLPPTCISLESDTQKTDVCTLQGEQHGISHICPSVRRMLPQLVQLRLRTKTMCPAIFHTGVDNQDPASVQPEKLSEDGFVPMPAIRSVLIDCGKAYVGNYSRCRADMVAAYRADVNMLAWATITKTMQRMLDVTKLIRDDVSDPVRGRDNGLSAWLRDPSKVKLLTIGHTDHDNHDDMLWAAVVRADMLKKESWAIPIRQIWTGDIPGSWLIRLPDGREVMGTAALLQALAADGDEIWLDLWDGARLPRRIVKAGADAGQGRVGVQSTVLAELCGGFSGVRPDSPSLKTREEWQKDNPRKWGTHWKKEDMSGQRVISAEKRVGRDDYTSLRLISEIVPESEE